MRRESTTIEPTCAGRGARAGEDATRRQGGVGDADVRDAARDALHRRCAQARR
jgi:hypothetical protein